MPLKKYENRYSPYLKNFSFPHFRMVVEPVVVFLQRSVFDRRLGFEDGVDIRFRSNNPL